MRRFVTVLALLFFTIPFGISLTGCGKKGAPPVFCNGGDTGLTVGQLQTIALQPRLTGLSLNQAQEGQVTSPTATDCKGNSVSVTAYTYASTNIQIADVNPTTGALCGGSWNRNTPGGIANFTTCTATTTPGVAFITASANGVSSNAIPVYVHPIVTSIVLGAPSVNCATDPATNCSPASVNSTIAASAITGCPAGDPQLANGCCTTPPNNFLGVAQAPPYAGVGCLSQTQTGQLSARAFAGTGSSQTNISCEVGQVAYTAQTPSVVTIDTNGIATAQQPGSTIITTTLAQAGSTAGYFSTCPPVDIALSFPNTAAGTGSAGNPLTVDPNFTQPITAVATDKNGQVLNGLAFEYTSTAPIPIPAATGGTITPVFPGEAAITAVCQPPACNPAPNSEIGISGNGVPVSSHALSVTTPGTNSTVLYIASTQSRFLVPVDFTQNTLGAPILLPFAPNSMAISNDGTTLYLGSPTELMVLSTATGAITAQNTSDSGYVLGVAPNNGTAVIADPVRKQIYLYTATTTTGTGATAVTSGGTIATTFGFTPTFDANNNLQAHASWSPDSQTVYIATGDQILAFSQQTGWINIPLTGTSAVDVTTTVPAVGAYFAGPTTSARGYCPVTTTTPAPAGNGIQTPSATNVFYPSADPVTGTPPTDTPAAANTDRLAATNDGQHILGASATTGLLSDIAVNLAPLAFTIQSGAATPANGTLSPNGAIVCPSDNSGLSFTNAVATTSLTAPNAKSTIVPTTITGILTTSVATSAPAPATAFVTYNGSGGVIPMYQPNAIQNGTGTGAGTSANTPVTPLVTPGTLTDIPLVTATGAPAPSAPVAGAVSTDNSTLFVGTSGDALVHLIAITGTPSIAGLSSAPTPLTDFKQIAPNLPCSPLPPAPGNVLGELTPKDVPPCITSNGQSIAVPNLLVQKPRPTT